MWQLPYQASTSTLEVKDAEEVLAYLLDTTSDDVRIDDLSVQPGSGTAYLSVTRRGGADTHHVLVPVRGAEDFEVLEFEDMEHQRASFEDAPAPDSGDRRSQHAQSITDLVFHHGTCFWRSVDRATCSPAIETRNRPTPGRRRRADVRKATRSTPLWQGVDRSRAA